MRGAGTDPFMIPIVLVLIALLAVPLALAGGLSWRGLLRWTGELLLIIGIALAAKGISDVRREWTGLPGIWGRIKQIAQAIRVRAASVLWARWNWVLKWEWLAKRLHLRPHGKAAYGSATIPAGASVTATAVWRPRTARPRSASPGWRTV